MPGPIHVAGDLTRAALIAEATLPVQLVTRQTCQPPHLVMKAGVPGGRNAKCLACGLKLKRCRCEFTHRGVV